MHQVPRWFSEDEYEVVRAACARLIPTDDDPGADEARVADYIEALNGSGKEAAVVIRAQKRVLQK